MLTGQFARPRLGQELSQQHGIEGNSVLKMCFYVLCRVLSFCFMLRKSIPKPTFEEPLSLQILM